MKAEYTREGWRDFNQRYSDTFGWFEGSNGPVLVRLDSVSETTLRFSDSNGMGYTANVDRGNTFSFIPVIKGCYMYNGDVVVVERKPARQWKRGICVDNTTIRNLNGDHYDVDFPILRELFSGNPDNSVARYKQEGILPVLLDNQFSVGKGLGIYLYTSLIGELDPVNKIVILEEELFKQEMQDLVNRHALGWEVKC